MSSLVPENKNIFRCGLSSLSVKAIFMAAVVLLVGLKVQEQIHKRPPSLLFCWEETNPLVNNTADVTICDLNHEDDRFPNCQLPPRKAFVDLLEAYTRMEQAFSRFDPDMFKSYGSSKLFDSITNYIRVVREAKAEVQEELDKEARKVRICDRNETEVIFRLALFIILVDFLSLALDGFLTIASSGRIWTWFLL